MKRAEVPQKAHDARSRAGSFWRAVKLLCVVAFVTVVGLSGGLFWAVCDTLGGAEGVREIYHVWRDPGRRAFGDRDRLNVLCLGVDYNHDRRGMPFTKHARTDTMFVVSIDRKAKGLSIVSIPRDTRVEIPGHGFDKINAAFSYTADGARDLTVKTVERFLDINIDHTIVIKPYAAEHLVGALGGVTLDVEKDMDYDDNWGNLHIHLKKGSQHLNGKQAVGYIRFRHDAEGDRGRVRRQQQLINATLAQLPRIETLVRIQQVRAAIVHDVKTTLRYDQLVDIGMLYKSFDRRKIRMGCIQGNDTLIDGSYYMVADDAQKRRIVAQLLRVHQEKSTIKRGRAAVSHLSRDGL